MAVQVRSAGGQFGKGLGLDVSGASALVANLRMLATDSFRVRALAGGMVVEAEKTMTLSRLQAPVRDGILRGSATVEQPRVAGSSVEVRMGYGGAAKGYARKVHENPRAGKTGRPGAATTGKWHFLSDPFLARQQATLDGLAASVWQDIVRRLVK
jgi:hypothetical protein